MTRAEELLKYGSYFDQAEVVASFLNDSGWPTYAAIVRKLGRAAQGIETAKPPRREAGLAREGESPVGEADAPKSEGSNRHAQ